MKKFSFLLSLLTVLGLYSCSQEDAFLEGTPSKGLTAQIPSYQFDNQTRVNISPNLSTFTWSDGDKIGIYQHTTYNDASAVFRINQGGSSSGVFSNESFSLKPNTTYYAFYPYDSDATVDSYPVDFTGQVQTANGSTAHIGARNYMSAIVNTDDNGAANIAFQNLAAVIQVVIPIEEVGIYTGVTLSSSAGFITRGSLDLKTGVITPAEKSQQMGLSFGKGLALNEGDELVANFLVAPTDLSGKSLTILLTERNGSTLSAPGYGKKIEKGKAYRFESGEMNEIPYLTFTAGATQTLSMSKTVETLEYSVNGGDWQELGTNTVTFGGANGNLRLRGKSSMGTANSYSDYSQISFGNATKVACSGDIRTLVDYENYKATNTKNARFCRLFQYCSSLTSAPSLPATTLASSCYYCMFWGCSSLTSAPSLPATTLASSCYSCMFFNCSSLTSAPSLPATTLASDCYASMFYGCSSLTSAPSLPATTLASSCYYCMFAGCSSLTSAPSLPATTLAGYCYNGMFESCSSLTSAPSLPATTLADVCYFSMFRGCSSLTSAPSLPATTLASSCYSCMFEGCSKLNYIKMMATDISAERCLNNWTNGVSITGTFIKNAEATWEVSGSSGIPYDWTIETATE